jgi:hypothetical protein
MFSLSTAVMAHEPTALSPEHAHLAIVLAAEYAPPGLCGVHSKERGGCAVLWDVLCDCACMCVCACVFCEGACV